MVSNKAEENLHEDMNKFILAAASGIDKNVMNILCNYKLDTLKTNYDFVIYYNQTSTYLNVNTNGKFFLFQIIDNTVMSNFNKYAHEYCLSTDNERIVNDYAISICAVNGRPIGTNKVIVLINKFTREILCYCLPDSPIITIYRSAVKYFPEVAGLTGKHILDSVLQKELDKTNLYNIIKPEITLCTLSS